MVSIDRFQLAVIERCTVASIYRFLVVIERCPAYRQASAGYNREVSCLYSDLYRQVSAGCNRGGLLI